MTFKEINIQAEEMRSLVFAGVFCGSISLIRASEILGMKLTDFQQEWQQWHESRQFVEDKK